MTFMPETEFNFRTTDLLQTASISHYMPEITIKTAKLKLSLLIELILTKFSQIEQIYICLWVWIFLRLRTLPAMT